MYDCNLLFGTNCTRQSAKLLRKYSYTHTFRLFLTNYVFKIPCKIQNNTSKEIGRRKRENTTYPFTLRGNENVNSIFLVRLCRARSVRITTTGDTARVLERIISRRKSKITISPVVHSVTERLKR